MNQLQTCYAIIPDGCAEPAALFEHLEDAMDWGLQRYGGDAFRIRYLEVAPVEVEQPRLARAV